MKRQTPLTLTAAQPAGFAMVAILVVLTAIMMVIALYYPRVNNMAGKPAISTATKAAATSAVGPQATFTAITESSGIWFIHDNGAMGEKLLPETMGGGVAFWDYDDDGRPDLVLINSGPWPWSGSGIGSTNRAQRIALYHNEGGRFADVTAGSGLDMTGYGMGVAVGDIDNDGRVELFVTAIGGNRLFRNLGGGKFQDATGESGLTGNANEWSTSAGWFDFDNDGLLDLFVCNYLQWTREADLAADFRMPGVGRAYGPPLNFSGAFCRLYRNQGGGQFADVSAKAGIQVKHPATGLPLAKALGLALVDMDGDGWMDIIVANDTVQNFVFRNQHDGTFKEIGARSGIALDAFGKTRGAMGIDAARWRNDNTLAIAIGNFANEMNALYVSQTNSLFFADQAVEAGLGPASQALNKFGLFFFDFDLDGRLDVMTANGHLEPDIHRAHATQQYRQPAQLFWNSGTGQQSGFAVMTKAQCGSDLLQPIVGRGAAYADFDGDGDLDVVLTQINGPPLLLRNDQQLGHHWMRFKLMGTRCNRDAIGAWIRVRSGGQTQERHVMPARSYLSQVELPVTIGLGTATKVDDVQILWPDGTKQKLENFKVDALNLVKQP